VIRTALLFTALSLVLLACSPPVDRSASNPGIGQNPPPEQQGEALARAYMGLLRDAEVLLRNRPAAKEAAPRLDQLIEGYERLFRSLEGRKARLTESDQSRVDAAIATTVRSSKPPFDSSWLPAAAVYYESRDRALSDRISGLAVYLPVLEVTSSR
jgi:hypothetical protein